MKLRKANEQTKPPSSKASEKKKINSVVLVLNCAVKFF